MPVWVAQIIAWFSGALVQKVLNCIPKIIADVEQAMKDGQITEDERKDLAMKMIDSVADAFGIKITGPIRWAISTLIDYISRKLPSKSLDLEQMTKTAIAKG